MPTTCPPGAPVVAVGAPVIGAVAANVDFTQANIQTENLFACAFDGTGAQVGWVFKVIEDNLGEGANAALTQETLKLVDATGAVTTPYDPVASGHTLGNCGASGGDDADYDIHEMCDDVNGDGSVIVRYFEAAKLELDLAGNVIRTITGTFTTDRLDVAYAPVNGVECETIGVPVVGLEPRRVVLNGLGAWTAPAAEILTSLTIETRTVNNAAAPPQFTDGAGSTTDLFEGTETFEAEWLAGSGGLTGNPLSVTTGAGDLVVVLYTVADT